MHKHKIVRELSASSMRIVLAVLALVAGASFCFALSFHSAGVFYYINTLPIPWMVYGILLIIAAILLVISNATRPIGYMIGGVVYTVFSLAAWLACIGSLHAHLPIIGRLVDGYPRSLHANIFAAANITTIAVLYWVAMKEAIMRNADPEVYGKTKL